MEKIRLKVFYYSLEGNMYSIFNDIGYQEVRSNRKTFKVRPWSSETTWSGIDVHICAQQWLWLYLMYFLRYINLLAENKTRIPLAMNVLDMVDRIGISWRCLVLRISPFRQNTRVRWTRTAAYILGTFHSTAGLWAEETAWLYAESTRPTQPVALRDVLNAVACLNKHNTLLHQPQ